MAGAGESSATLKYQKPSPMMRQVMFRKRHIARSRLVKWQARSVVGTSDRRVAYAYTDPGSRSLEIEVDAVRHEFVHDVHNSPRIGGAEIHTWP